MITGLVNSRFEAICPFSIQDVNGQYHDLEAILDTGFSGWLTLPPGVIAALALAFDGHTIVLLADGSTQMRARYSASIVWDGIQRSIIVTAMDGPPLLGTQLLIGYNLRIRFQMGGSVEIEAIP